MVELEKYGKKLVFCKDNQKSESRNANFTHIYGLSPVTDKFQDSSHQAAEILSNFSVLIAVNVRGSPVHNLSCSCQLLPVTKIVFYLLFFFFALMVLTIIM